MTQTTAYSTIHDPIIRQIFDSNDMGHLTVSMDSNMSTGYLLFHPLIEYVQANQETLDYLELIPNYP